MKFVTKLDCLTQDEFLSLLLAEKHGGLPTCVIDIFERLDLVITEVAKEHEERVEALNEDHERELKELRVDLDDMTEKRDDLASKVDELRGELKDLEKEKETLEEKVSSLEDELNDLHARLSKLDIEL